HACYGRSSAENSVRLDKTPTPKRLHNDDRSGSLTSEMCVSPTRTPIPQNRDAFPPHRNDPDFSPEAAFPAPPSQGLPILKVPRPDGRASPRCRRRLGLSKTPWVPRYSAEIAIVNSKVVIFLLPEQKRPANKASAPCMTVLNDLYRRGYIQ